MKDAPVSFDSIARLPRDGDNVAIATRPLDAGLTVERDGTRMTLSHSLLEGHRFACEPIKRGEELLSWSMPFGKATRDVAPGEYVCNARIIEALAERNVPFKLPESHNFEDHSEVCKVDRATFQPGEQVPATDAPATFMGYRRPGTRRGVGTRNFVVVLAVTGQASGFARQVAARYESKIASMKNVDGVVAVTHTEGGGTTRPNNIDFVMRTLAGFMVHPNVGGVVAVDYGDGSFTGDDLRTYMRENDYPLRDMPHSFFQIDADHGTEIKRATGIIDSMIDSVNDTPRTEESAGNIRVALQCGGSDAFSGISGNALAGWVAKQFITNGGGANIAETDELIGAEPYMLANVRDADTAQRFLDKIEIFKRRVANHGASAEGNPSGGNNYRGLYNIALKSIGAARKKDPEVRLDYVIDYGAPMKDPGYYFMDSPGNDLESIAGQVAAGCNLIFFITGNGSITNFPFVPTLKFVTTTGRFEMLQSEMDVNAGRYNDGESMDSLGQETFELALDISSGTMSKGELAGHAQVQLWRDWAQTNDSQLKELQNEKTPGGAPIATVTASPLELSIDAWRTDRGPALEQVGLIMPTSLCSGQVARVIAEELNADDSMKQGVDRYVALVHTEGCGAVNAESLYLDTLVGHLQHSNVRHAVMLEHGCEKTHNDAIAGHLKGAGLKSSDYGWASVQLDGGLKSVSKKVTGQFRDALGNATRERVKAGPDSLHLALTSAGPVEDAAAKATGEFAARAVAGGGTIVLASNASLLENRAFVMALFADGQVPEPSIGYGHAVKTPGLHIMDAPSPSVIETITGLGATGARLMMFYAGKAPVQAHPMIPLVQFSASDDVTRRFGADLDLVLASETDGHSYVTALRDVIDAVANGRQKPKLYSRGNTEFQLTRGRLGISL